MILPAGGTSVVGEVISDTWHGGAARRSGGRAPCGFKKSVDSRCRSGVSLGLIGGGGRLSGGMTESAFWGGSSLLRTRGRISYLGAAGAHVARRGWPVIPATGG